MNNKWAGMTFDVREELMHLFSRQAPPELKQRLNSHPLPLLVNLGYISGCALTNAKLRTASLFSWGTLNISHV